MKSHYETLGVEKKCTHDEIRKAYKKLVLKAHPDKGGSSEDFQNINDAYNTLSDPEKRLEYDDSSNGMRDLFRSMNLHTRKPVVVKRKSPDIKYDITLSLEEMYMGKIRKLAISRSKKCASCNGEGGVGRRNEICVACSGKGIRIIHRGSSSLRAQCMKCAGSGKNIAFDKLCEPCGATRLVRERTVIEVTFPPGCVIGSKIIVPSEGNCTNGTEKGNVVITARQKNHPVFKRVGKNLRCTIDITLVESLCGFEKDLVHLDGRTIKISHTEIIKHNDKINVLGEGIPRGEGSLDVFVNVIYPESFSCEKKQELLKILN